MMPSVKLFLIQRTDLRRGLMRLEQDITDALDALIRNKCADWKLNARLGKEHRYWASDSDIAAVLEHTGYCDASRGKISPR